MKRHPSIKGRARFSDSTDSADHATTAVIDRRDIPRGKQLERRDRAAADAPWTSEWDGAEPESIGPKPRR
jgi:hypothetical protein